MYRPGRLLDLYLQVFSNQLLLIILGKIKQSITVNPTQNDKKPIVGIIIAPWAAITSVLMTMTNSTELQIFLHKTICKRLCL